MLVVDDFRIWLSQIDPKPVTGPVVRDGGLEWLGQQTGFRDPKLLAGLETRNIRAEDFRGEYCRERQLFFRKPRFNWGKLATLTGIEPVLPP